jgi:hypothetical protein
VADLLQQDLKISMCCHPEGSFESYGSWVEIPFEDFPDPFFDSSDVTKAVLLRSESGLGRIVRQDRTSNSLGLSNIIKLYKMATRKGWVRGCEILFDAGLTYTPELDNGNRPAIVPDPFLFDAIESQNPDMVSFWLDVREGAKADHLPYIGELEAAVTHASDACCIEYIAKILLARLVEKRYQLQQMTEIYNLEGLCTTRSEVVLDAHTICAPHFLNLQRHDVPYLLLPSARSVYNSKWLYREKPRIYQRSSNPIRTLQLLYDAGFQDIAEHHFKCSRDAYCSPLVFATTGYRRLDPSPGTCTRFFQIIDWFLSKGANLSECWPGSKTTALHCIATKAATLTWNRPLERSSLAKIATVLRSEATDDCECSCSIHGCCGITSFWKGSYRFDVGYMAEVNALLKKDDDIEVKPSNHQRIGRWELERIVRCVAAAARRAEHRWIVTEFIRLCLFSLLGIRHICCNINNIEHRGEPDFKRQPLPRYPEDKVQRVMEEDRHLKILLEELVPRLDAQYDIHTGDLQAFVDERLLPQTKTVLDRLREDDDSTYAVGRRDLGVIMEKQASIYRKLL